MKSIHPRARVKNEQSSKTEGEKELPIRLRLSDEMRTNCQACWTTLRFIAFDSSLSDLLLLSRPGEQRVSTTNCYRVFADVNNDVRVTEKGIRRAPRESLAPYVIVPVPPNHNRRTNESSCRCCGMWDKKTDCDDFASSQRWPWYWSSVYESCSLFWYLS